MDVPGGHPTGLREGFDCFPRRLPDDCVEYVLFIIDAKLESQKELLARLEVVRKEAIKLTNGLLKDYIWQRDAFKLDIERNMGLIYLHGLTNYGDAVEDEWLVVYILRELSNRFPDLWAKVTDTDGEFLLIEAANVLPRWLNPEIADNRVWINSNELHLVPLLKATEPSSTQTASISRCLSLEEAYNTLSSNTSILIHSPLIEAEAFYRLRNYPAQIETSLHHAILTIPRKLAFLLHERPVSVAPATESFYLRDPIALKPLQSNPPNLLFPPEDLVNVSVRLTRVIFAQLKSQQFSTPIAWKGIIARAGEKALSNGPAQKLYDQLELGMKVTSGFEMLLTDSKHRDRRTVRELAMILNDVESGETGLPTDVEIAAWRDSARGDDETWLNINFEEFERELQGNSNEKEISTVHGAFGPETSPGFGDAETKANLRKMVERFEAFLNDDKTGPDGAEMDEMDFDDEEDDSEIESEEEDKGVSFDEEEFARMMREMMGMPSDQERNENEPDLDIDRGRTEKTKEGEKELAEDEATQIHNMAQRMEAELKEAGALQINPTTTNLTVLGDKAGSLEREHWENESNDESISIDYDLAKNLLESFKEAGVPGPGDNLMRMMGMQQPRDEAGTSKY